MHPSSEVICHSQTPNRMAWYTLDRQPYPREYNKVETLPAVQDNICNWALFGHHGKQLAKKNDCANLELDVINSNWNREIPMPSATTKWKTLQTMHSWLCGECDPFLNWMPKVHTFERSIIQRSNYNRSDFSHWNQFQASGCRIPQSQLQKHTCICYSPLIV